MFCDDEHPLFDYVQPDLIWWAIVREKVQEERFLQAWELIKKAHVGVPLENHGVCSREFPVRNRHQATCAYLKSVIRYFFDAMVETEQLPALEESDRVFPDVVYDMKNVHTLKSVHEGQPRTYVVIHCMDQPGLSMAYNIDHNERLVGNFTKPEPGSRISPEAAMCLKIALYFKRKREN